MVQTRKFTVPILARQPIRFVEIEPPNRKADDEPAVGSSDNSAPVIRVLRTVPNRIKAHSF